jgi:putative intracellular protease/amidase
MIENDVHFAVYDTLADWEFGYVTAHLGNGMHHREPGSCRIVTVGPTRAPIRTMGGLRIVPDLALTELAPADSALLVLSGAGSWESGVLAPFAHAARTFLVAGTPVAAICGATYGLAVEGLLDDRPHTSAGREYLETARSYRGSAHYVDELVVRDGDLITASPVAPVEFARAIFDRLDVYEPAVLASWYKLYGEQDAQGFYELMSA